jgi:hypothetical protein
MVRTPATRSFPGDLKDTILRVELDLWRPADLGRYFVGRGRHIAEELWEELWEIYMDKRGATSDGDAEFHIGLMRQFEPSFTATVQERGWTLIRCTGGLVTTDHPVAMRIRTKPTADGQQFGIQARSSSRWTGTPLWSSVKIRTQTSRSMAAVRLT